MLITRRMFRQKVVGKIYFIGPYKLEILTIQELTEA